MSTGSMSSSLKIPIGCPGSFLVFRLLAQPHVIKGKHAALEQGCLEAVLTDDHGRIQGCTEGQVFRVVDGVIRQASDFPPEVTGRVIQELAAASGVPLGPRVEEIALRLDARSPV